jgi:hypothetical protein
VSLKLEEPVRRDFLAEVFLGFERLRGTGSFFFKRGLGMVKSFFEQLD